MQPDIACADPREVWDRRFGSARRHGIRMNYAPWLARWLVRLEIAGPAPILDLGCGCGFDTRYLRRQGLQVLAADLSRQALRATGEVAPGASVLEVDVRRGLPFCDGAFQAVVANLSLHYHRWARTCAVVAEVRRVIRAGGYLLMRVNALDPLNPGTAGSPCLEPHCYSVNGVLKRFFDRDDLLELFGAGWRLHNLEAQVIHCYEKPKAIWEVVAAKLTAG